MFSRYGLVYVVLQAVHMALAKKNPELSLEESAEITILVDRNEFVSLAAPSAKFWAVRSRLFRSGSHKGSARAIYEAASIL